MWQERRICKQLGGVLVGVASREVVTRLLFPFVMMARSAEPKDLAAGLRGISRKRCGCDDVCARRQVPSHCQQ